MESLTPFRIDLPTDLHRKLKLEATMRGSSMREIAIKAIEREILAFLDDKKAGAANEK